MMVRGAGNATLMLGLCGALMGCAEEPAPAPVLRPVRSELVRLSGGTQTRTFSGTARAGQEIQLSFRVPGRIEKLNLRVGENVGAGALIAQLEREDYEIRVQQARASLSQAEANLRNAENNLDRIRGLWESNNASQSDLDAAEAGAESSAAQVEVAKKELESAERQLGYTTLTAPVDGAIAEISVEVNENVLQGQHVVLLTSGSRPEVQVAVPGVVITEVRDGQPVTVRFDAIPGYALDAVVTEVGVAATGTATTFPVIVRLVDQNEAIRSGMAAEVTFRFQSSEDEDAIFVPAVSVGADRDGRFVFVVEPADEPGVGIVRRRAVEVERRLLAGETMRILSGIEPGERIVTAGVRRLIDGQQVKLGD